MTLYWLCDDQLCFCADDSFVDGYSLKDCKNSDRDPIYIGVCPSQSDDLNFEIDTRHCVQISEDEYSKLSEIQYKLHHAKQAMLELQDEQENMMEKLLERRGDRP